MDFYRRHELPETVRRYKIYTNQFQEWLIKTASTRGVEIAQQISGQAKKGNRKKGHKISVEQQERLVDSIAETNETLGDTSGLLDLGDAIRSRKEVAQYYKLNNQMDEGHEYFNSSLGKFMATLSKFVPTFRQTPDVDDKASNFARRLLIIRFSPEDNHGEDEDDDNDDAGSEAPQAMTSSLNIPVSTSGKRPNDVSLTQNERELQHDFLILRFLYEFNLIRQTVRNVWRLYRRGLVTAITAALVTDLAQSHVQQIIAGLVEDLDIARGKLLDAIRALYRKVNARPKPGSRATEKQELQERVLRDVLCIESIKHIHSYLFAKDKTMNDPNQVVQSDQRVQTFLQFFATIRSEKIALPIWDTLTENLLRHVNGSADWLPFGLQIIIDIQGVVHEVNHTLLKDTTEHSLDISRLMQAHIEYEDRMWAVGNKPDYCAKENFKFSTTFLQPLNSMLVWVQRLLPSSGPTPNESQMTTDTFVAVHTTLAGLAMWKHNKTYHSTAMNKVQWFIILLCHVYNAARQIGGLELAWPDLDFIIQTHGNERIFIGAPPTHPDDFLDRYLLAIGISAEFMAVDHRSSEKSFMPWAPREVQQKRGLKVHSTLEEKINNYYRPDPDNDRWLKRHSIFHHLYHQTSDISDPSAPKSVEAVKQVKELQQTFSSIAAHLCPPKTKNKRNKAARVPMPDFSKIDATHASLLSKMTTELQSHEVHDSFDYLSFYRNAYDFVLKIRGEVLFDNDMALARRTNLKKDPDPNHQLLLVDLFRSLKTQARNRKVKTTGDEVSTDVVPLEQMKRIAKIMEGLIGEKGAMELGRARMRVSRDWDSLKASYAAEEVARQKAGLRVSDVGDSDEHESIGHESEAPAEGDSPITEHPDRKEHVDDVKEAENTGTTSKVDNTWAKVSGRELYGKAVKETDFELPMSLRNELDVIANLNQIAGDEIEREFSANMKQMIAKHLSHAANSHLENGVKLPSDEQPTHQAYVADEADELGEPKVAISSTTYLQDQDPLYKEEEHRVTEMKGKKRLSEAPSPMFQFRALDGRSVQVDHQGVYVDQVVKRLKVVKKPKRRTTAASKPVTQTKGEDKALQFPTFPKTATIPLFNSPLPPSLESKPKRSGYPEGIFHRLTYSHRVLRKHVVTLQRSSTTARLTLTRKRPTYIKHLYATFQQAARRHQHQFAVTSKKHTIALPCYASCCMARALLGQETKLQCRIGRAGRAARAKVWESESDRDLE